MAGFWVNHNILTSMQRWEEQLQIGKEGSLLHNSEHHFQEAATTRPAINPLCCPTALSLPTVTPCAAGTLPKFDLPEGLQHLDLSSNSLGGKLPMTSTCCQWYWRLAIDPFFVRFNQTE